MKRIVMKAALALGGSTLLLANPAFAQEEAATATEAVATSPALEKATGPALWKVADEDTTIYLFGTVHALPPGMNWYGGSIEEALASSDELVTEIISDEQTAVKMQQLVLAKGMLPADQSLRGLLDDDQRERFNATMTKLGLPEAAFDRFEPWYASMMFSMLPLMKEGYSPESGVEFVLGAAAGKDKPRGELETVEQQISFFDTMPQEMQLSYMMETVDMVDEIKPLLDEMVAEWLEGDADALADLLNESMSDKELAEILLYSRNRTWAEWIDTRLDTPGTIFIAVGAGHLAGAQSVQDALMDRGIPTARVQ